ncbi:MAG: hypothetical protein J6N53_04705 [Lachnospiraceae bacterium]|nr:hypothetical protein [Lachnospiraceae bacterium]MBR3517357.1 hypothetical protein [Lachnospiraceae bacterium]
MAKAGRPKQEIKKEQIVTFRLTEDDYRRLKAYAISHGRTITQVLQKSVSDLIENESVQDLQSVDERRNEDGIEKRSERQSSSEGGML